MLLDVWNVLVVGVCIDFENIFSFGFYGATVLLAIRSEQTNIFKSNA